MTSITSFPADTVPQAPEDALFGLARAYRADTSPLKVDLVLPPSPPDNRRRQRPATDFCVCRESALTAATMRSLGCCPL